MFLGSNAGNEEYNKNCRPVDSTEVAVSFIFVIKIVSVYKRFGSDSVVNY